MNRNQFVTALGIAKTAVDPKCYLPILSHALIKTTAHSLTLTCTNFILSIQVKLEAPSTVTGVTTADAELLYKLVKSLPDNRGEAKVDLALEKNGLGIQSGKSKYRIGTADPADFPPLDNLRKPECEMAVATAELRELLAAVLHASKKDGDHQPILTGILFRAAQDHLTVTACNGHQLALTRGTFKSTQEFEAVIPHEAVKALLGILGGNDDQQEVRLQFDRNYVQFTVANVRLLSRQLDGKYPDYQKVIPKFNPESPRLNRLELLAYLKRLTLINSGVTFAFGKELVLHSQSENQSRPGEATEVMELAQPGTGRFKVNADYFIAMLESVNDDEIQVQPGKEREPVVLKSPNKPWLCVVMPLVESAKPPVAQTPASKESKTPSQGSATKTPTTKPEAKTPESKAAPKPKSPSPTHNK